MPSEPSGLRTWSSRTVIQSLRYTSRDAMRRISSTRQVCRAVTGSLAGVLLASLNPAAVANGADIGDAVRIDGAVLSRSDLVGAATSVAERVGGAQRVAVLATPTATTVLAVTGCLIAGVPVVPVPADVGAAERRHILTDSGAQAVARGAARRTGGPAAHPGAAARAFVAPLRRAAAGGHRADHVHLRNHRTAEGRGAEPRAPSPPTSTRWPRRGSGRRTTPWCTGCRCSTCTAWCSGCSGRCGSETASCTPENPRPPGTPDARGTLYFGVPTVWSRVVEDPDAAARAVVGPAAGVRQRGAAGAGVRPARRTHRPSAGRAVRHQRNADHRQHPGRRRATARLGRAAAARVYETRLVDDDGAPSPHDGETIGRLQVQTPTMFDGYLNRPDATAEAFDADGWYRTGDAAVIDATACTASSAASPST